VDFAAGVMRIYDNWVRNAVDTTNASDSAPIPMTPRLRDALLSLRSAADDRAELRGPGGCEDTTADAEHGAVMGQRGGNDRHGT
jgi:hypothetical protein